jgi:hypothetical protein
MPTISVYIWHYKHCIYRCIEAIESNTLCERKQTSQLKHKDSPFDKVILLRVKIDTFDIFLYILYFL